MDLKQYTFHIISVVFGSAALGSIITFFGSRGKTKAETQKILAETNNVIGDNYGQLLEAMQTQINFQGDQIKAQNQQINAMQARELELMKIINSHVETERELRKQIKALEAKLSKRISNIENI